jgi:chorismate synthase
VAAGAVARVFLASWGIEIRGWTSQAAGVDAPGPGEDGFDPAEIEKNPLRMPNGESARRAMEKIEALRQEGDSAGCLVSCLAGNLPPGLGEPVFDKLDARIAAAMLSLGAAKGVEFGAGFAAAGGRGSKLNDAPKPAGPGEGRELPPGVPQAAWKTNNAGGVLGGLSNGADLFFTVAFKPVSSIMQSQKTINRRGEEAELLVQGRHDICIGPRAVPVVEAMCALVLADFVLLQRSARL